MMRNTNESPGCGVGPFKYLSRVSLWGHKKKRREKKNFFFSLFWFGFGSLSTFRFFISSRAFMRQTQKRKEKKNLGGEVVQKSIQKSSKKKKKLERLCVPRRREQERQRDRERHRETQRETESNARAVKKKKSMAYDATLQFLTDEELAALIKAGPLYDSAIHEKNSGVEMEEKCGTARAVQLHRVAAQLGSDEQSLGALGRDRERVYHFYLPILFRVLFLLEEHRKKQKSDMEKNGGGNEGGEGGSKKQFYPKPLFIGIEAPQGLGKSTLVDVLQTLIDNSVVLSLDDLYLPRDMQQDLGQKKRPGKPFVDV